MNALRILADDLTGALDAAAPFASAAQPVHLSLAERLSADRQTVSSESRELELGDALRAVHAAHDRLRSAPGEDTLWFKKVDSVLRGWPVEETLELMRHLGFQTCVFAPAFPEMGRRTVAGLHETEDPGQSGGWLPAAIHDLRTAFEAAGAQVSMLGEAGAQRGILIGNAEAPGDLRALIGQAPQGPVLWAGSRGLAAALSPPGVPVRLPRVGAVVIGTSHPATRMQADRICRSGAESGVSMIDPVPSAASASQTVELLRSQVSEMKHPGADALLVVGGTTLGVVLSTVGARSLACIGEVAPGLPASVICGGRFDGVTLVSKSGGFGDAALLEQILFNPDDIQKA